MSDYILTRLIDESGIDFSYPVLILGLNKAFVNVLLMLAEDSDYAPEEASEQLL